MQITESLRTQFRDEGFLILQQVVPAEQLDWLRASTDTIVARARAADPSWDTTATPRTNLSDYADPATLGPVEFALHENTYGVSAQILDQRVAAVGVNLISVLCNPEFLPTPPAPSGQAWGTDPRNWHRDVRPDQDGPLSEIIVDEAENGPAYVQWNVALYDEAILYVIPGSHRRLTSEVEALQLQAEGKAISPLAGSVRVELNPGDGVVYNNSLLHWGSKYTPEKRRTLHFGYRSFHKIFPHQSGTTLREELCDALEPSSPSRRLLEASLQQYRAEMSIIEALLQTVVAADRAAFVIQLSKLHPAPHGHLACVIQLVRLVRGLIDASADSESSVASSRPLSQQLELDLANHLGVSGLAEVRRRFGALDDMLRGTAATHVKGFLGPPTEYYFEQLPTEVTLERAIAALVG